MATEYAYQGSPGYNGIITGLGNEAADGVTVTASSSGAFSGMVESRALSQDVSTSTGRFHSTLTAGAWWMVTFDAVDAVQLEGIAVRAQAYNDGLYHIPIDVEVRLAGTETWEALSQITVDPGNAGWTGLIDGGDKVIDAIRLTNDDGGANTYLILGSVEAWGVYDYVAPVEPLDTSSLQDDSLFAYLHENESANFTSGEVVGALNEINGTEGVEYAAARQTYLDNL